MATLQKEIRLTPRCCYYNVQRRAAISVDGKANKKRGRYLHGDVNELDEVADNTHDAKTDSNSSAELLVFYKNHRVRQLSAHLIEAFSVSVQSLVPAILHVPCSVFLLLMTCAIHSILVDCPASCYSNERHMDVKDRRSRKTISHED